MFSGLDSCCPDIFERPWASNVPQKKAARKQGRFSVLVSSSPPALPCEVIFSRAIGEATIANRPQLCRLAAQCSVLSVQCELHQFDGFSGDTDVGRLIDRARASFGNQGLMSELGRLFG